MLIKLRLYSLFIAGLFLTSFVLLAFPQTAKAELLIYTALEDDEVPVYLESFKKAHPNIKIKTIRDSTGVITAKLLAEKENPQADVIWSISATSLIVLENANLIEPYAPKGLDKVNPKMKDSANPPAWVGTKAYMDAFVLNTHEQKNLALPAPNSYQDLLDPKYKNQIAMPNPASSGTGYLAVAGILQLMGEEAGWAYLDALNENIAQYTHSGSKPAKMAASGEVALGITLCYRASTQKQKGDPIEVFYPKEGSGWDVEGNALVKKAKINPEAKIFLDWAISQPAMDAYAKFFPVTSVKTNVPVPAGYPANPSAQLIENNNLKWGAENRERILAEWTKRYDSKSEKK